MAELKSRLRADLTDAMKAKDKLRTGTLRMLLAAVQTEEVSGKAARELSDATGEMGDLARKLFALNNYFEDWPTDAEAATASDDDFFDAD